MGGRLSNWIDRPSQKDMADVDIIYDEGVSVHVYRTPESGNTVGFSNELDDPVYLKTITVRLDRPRLRGDTRDFVGLTDETDVHLGDRWHLMQQNGIVTKLKVVSVDFRHRTTEVGVDYE